MHCHLLSQIGLRPMDNLIEMTFEEADEQFKFILNSYDIDASFDGLMYETYGDEYAVSYTHLTLPTKRIV